MPARKPIQFTPTGYDGEGVTYTIKAYNASGLFTPGQYAPYVTNQWGLVVSLECQRNGNLADSYEGAIENAKDELQKMVNNYDREAYGF